MALRRHRPLLGRVQHRRPRDRVLPPLRRGGRRAGARRRLRHGKAPHSVAASRASTWTASTSRRTCSPSAANAPSARGCIPLSTPSRCTSSTYRGAIGRSWSAAASASGATARTTSGRSSGSTQHLEPGGTLVFDNEVPYANPRDWTYWPSEKRKELPQPWPPRGRAPACRRRERVLAARSRGLPRSARAVGPRRDACGAVARRRARGGGAVPDRPDAVFPGRARDDARARGLSGRCRHAAATTTRRRRPTTASSSSGRGSSGRDDPVEVGAATDGDTDEVGQQRRVRALAALVCGDTREASAARASVDSSISSSAAGIPVASRDRVSNSGQPRVHRPRIVGADRLDG